MHGRIRLPGIRAAAGLAGTARTIVDSSRRANTYCRCCSGRVNRARHVGDRDTHKTYGQPSNLMDSSCWSCLAILQCSPLKWMELDVKPGLATREKSCGGKTFSACTGTSRCAPSTVARLLTPASTPTPICFVRRFRDAHACPSRLRSQDFGKMKP